MQRVDERGRADDRRAVLVVVEDRYVHGLLEFFLDVEALRRLDVLEVDAAEGGLKELHHLDHVIGMLTLYLQVEDVHVGETLEEDPFPLHDRFARQRADVAEAQHCGAVGDHRHQVPLGGVEVRVGRALLDRETRFGDPGGVCEREVQRGEAGL